MTIRHSKAREFIERIAIPYTGDDCLAWPFGKSSDGYGRYRATINRRKVSVPASRFICIAVHGQPPSPRHEAAHSCGNGRGVAIEDGIELRVFERLASMGLVVMASANLYARITPAGRAALSRDGRGDG